MELKDKKAFITGGSSGIGLSLARSLSARGAHVFIGARRAEGLDTALLEMKRVQVSPLQRCGTVQLDVTKPDQVTRAVENLNSELGLPDLVINSAGVVHPGYIQDLDLDVFRWMMEVNYFGTVYTTQAFLKGMIERRSGIIVNIASLTAAQSVFGYGAYGPSKFAVRAYTDTLRIEMKPVTTESAAAAATPTTIPISGETPQTLSACAEQ